MYSQDLESNVIQRALDRGFLQGASPEDLDPSPLADLDAIQHSSNFGPRLDRMMANGLLSQKAVETLLWEVILEARSSPMTSASRPEATHLNSGEWTDPELEARGYVPHRFTDLQLIGEGATAKVYKAFDTQLQRWIALKCLKARHADHPENLLAEARAQAKIEHPNVCRVHEVGLVGERGYIAMELARGTTLAHLAGELNLESKIRLIREVAEGVHAAHRQGLVHLDLKPGNILLQPKEDGTFHPLVTDFGMVRSTDEPGTFRPCPMGTPPFSSPEQIAGDPDHLDRRSDVYTLGVVLYVTLSGQFPFAASNLPDLLDAIQNREPVPLRQRDPQAPEDIEAILAACTAKDPQHRYPSAQALADDLQRFLTGEPVQARRRTFQYRLERWKGRNRLVVIVLLLAALTTGVTGATLGYSAWYERRQGEWALKFEQEVDHWETFLHQVYALPSHDIRPEVAQVREGLRRMEQEVALGGRPAQGPGHYALGRMNRLLGRDAGWWAHTEKAWKSGYHTPQSMITWAEVLIEQFEMHGVYSGQDPSIQSQQTLKLRQRYLDPAVNLLTKADSLLTGPLLQVANIRLARAQEDLPKALALAEQYRRARGWDYEAIALEAEVRRQMVWNLALEGELIRIRKHVFGVEIKDRSRVSELLEGLRRVKALDDQILHMVPSQPASYMGAAETSRYRTMLLITPDAEVDRANAETERIIQEGFRVDPENIPLCSMLRLHDRASLLPDLWERGEDPRPLQRQIIDLDRRRSPAAGDLVISRTSFPDWIKSSWIFGQVDSKAVHTFLREVEAQANEYRRLSEGTGDIQDHALFSLAPFALAQAQVDWEFGQDPTDNLDRVFRWVHPRHDCGVWERRFDLEFNAWILKAEFAHAQGVDPQGALTEAEKVIQEVRQGTPIPNDTLPFLMECTLARVRTQFQPTAEFSGLLKQAASALEQAALAPPVNRWNRYRAFLEVGKAHLLLARLALDHAEPADASLHAARRVLEASLACFPQSTEVPERLAQCALLESHTAPSPRQCLEAGLAMAERSLRYPQPLTHAEVQQGKRAPLPPTGLEVPHQPRSLRVKEALQMELARLEHNRKRG